MKKRRFLSILVAFLLIMPLSTINAELSRSLQSFERNLSQAGKQSVHRKSNQDDGPMIKDNMLQFRAGGHVLGFQPSKAYFAGLDHALSVEFLGASGAVPASAGAAQGMGNMSKAPSLSKVVYQDLWPGITLAYESTKGGIAESTYQIAPRADISKIRLRYNVPVEKQRDGLLKLTFEGGFMTESAPVAWQEIGGKRLPVEVSFRVSEAEVGFSVGKYDPDLPLTIDPSYTWHSFYTSNIYDDGYRIAVDGSGNVYVTGESSGTWNGPSGETPLHTYSGNGDIFVLKLNGSGAYQWHTFFGSSYGDGGSGIAVDGSGNIYVTGESWAPWNGPSGETPLHAYSGNVEMFVLKLNGNGAYQWHTFYGSSSIDSGNGIAVDGSGNVYIAGMSCATWNGPSGQSPLNAFVDVFGGHCDTFVMKLNGSGAYQWHTFYGPGSEGDGIAVDGSGNVYVMGCSSLTWNGPLGQFSLNAFRGSWDIFVLKLNGSGAYQWHTFCGSSTHNYGNYGNELAVDGNGNVYVTGRSDATWSGPSGQSPLNAYGGGAWNVFVLKLNASGAYQWHTFYGSGSEGYGIAVDGSGNVYATGVSSATWNGPSGQAPLNAYSGDADILVLKLNGSGTYQWHTFYGSNNADWGNGIAVDGSGNVYVTGRSDASWNGPLGQPPLNGIWGGILVLKMSDLPALTVTKTGTGTGAVDVTGCNMAWFGNTGTCTVNAGASITLSGAASTGSTFGGWSYGTGSAASCTGTGNCTFSITANSGVTATFEICYYFLSHDASFSASGGAGIVTVTAQNGCGWTAKSNDTWLTITGGASGTGNGTVNYSVSFNQSLDERKGTMTIAGKTFTVIQAGMARDLTVAKSHAGNFTQGQTGATYSITVKNVGELQTTGMVTLIDGLPSGLSATGMSGTGWTCDLSSLTCTRSDALDAGGSYPPITLTVDVAVDAPSSVTNVATVSGGGEVNTANDIATDRTFINDIWPPTGSITINGGATTTRSASVRLTLSASDPSGVSQMCISNSITCTSWTTYTSSKSWTLSYGNGTKTVYAWFKDRVGNKNTTPYSASIIMDTTAPTNGTVIAAPGNGQVILTWTGFVDSVTDMAGYKVVYAVGSVPYSCSSGTAVPGYDGVSTTYTHNGLINGTTYGYRVCAIDKAGNISSGATASSKPVPETAPPTGSVIINGGAVATKSATVTLTLTASDNSLPIQMCISNTTACSLWTAFTTTKTWTLATGNGTKTVNVWFRDTWGNKTTTPASDSIILDSSAPTNGTVTATPGVGQVSLSWKNFSDTGSGIAGYKVVFATSSAPTSCLSGTLIDIFDSSTNSYVHDGRTNGITYYYRVCAIDNAGNMSSGATASAKAQ